MSDQLGHVEVATNGKRNGTEPSEGSAEASSSSSGESTEERLNRLMETIQTWDWRKARVEARQPASNEPAAAASALKAAAPRDVRPNRVDVRPDPVDVPQELVDVHPEPVLVPVASQSSREIRPRSRAPGTRRWSSSSSCLLPPR